MPEVNSPSLSAAILAGGKSRRMGQSKALLEIDGIPVIDRVAQILRQITSELLIIVSPGASPVGLNLSGAKIITDQAPNRGPLMAIFTALRATSASHCLVLACDLPLITVPILAEMIRVVDTYDAVVPITDNGYEPLCAVYTQSCLPVIKSRIERNQLSVHQLFTDLRIHAFTEWREVDPTGNAFLNMNTPTDYEIAKQLLTRQSEVAT